MSVPPPVVSSSAAASGLAPNLSDRQTLTPNMVYTIPPLPPSVFYSRDIIEKAKTLNLHRNQEHIRYAVAQSHSPRM